MAASLEGSARPALPHHAGGSSHCSKQYSRDAGTVEHAGSDEPAVHAWPKEFAAPKLPVAVPALVQLAHVKLVLTLPGKVTNTVPDGEAPLSTLKTVET